MLALKWFISCCHGEGRRERGPPHPWISSYGLVVILTSIRRCLTPLSQYMQCQDPLFDSLLRVHFFKEPLLGFEAGVL